MGKQLHKIIRQRRANRNRFLAARTAETDLLSMQRLPFDQFPAASVKIVSRQRMSQCGKVHPNLMGAPGYRHRKMCIRDRNQTLRRFSLQCLPQLFFRGFNPLNVRTKAPQLAYKVLITALDVADLFNLRDTVRSKRRNYQRSARPQVCRANRCRLQRRNALDYGNPPIDLNIRPHTDQLIYIPEPVIPDTLGDDRGSLCSAQQLSLIHI